MTVAHPERVVLFHDFSEALGGASHLVQVLIRTLRARDIPVTFIAGDEGRNFARDDVEFVSLGGKALLERSKLSAMTKGLYDANCAHVARQWIETHDTPGTIYHVHGWTKTLSPSIFRALKGVRDRLVLHGHDYFNCCPNGGFFNFVTESDCQLKPLSMACLRTQCDKSSYVEKIWRSGREALRRGLLSGGTDAARLIMIHPGQVDAFRLGGWPDEKLFAVRNPVTPPVAEGVEAQRNHEALFIGRISREKGADLAALAAAQAGIPITFVGDGAETEQVRALNPAAKFLGRQDRDGVANALRNARFAVMPSRWSEPFGLVALEAIGSGVPVILSDRALMAEEIQRSGFGLSLNTASIDLFAQAMAQLAADDELVAQMSQVGRQNYLDLCTTEDGWLDGVLANYAQVLQAARAPAQAMN